MDYKLESNDFSKRFKDRTFLENKVQSRRDAYIVRKAKILSVNSKIFFYRLAVAQEF